MRDHLVERLPRVDPARIDAMLLEERIVDRRGPITPDAPFVPEEFLWFHRDLPDEVPVPFECPLNVVGGMQLSGMQLGLRTELEVRGAIDPGDLDPIWVHPLPSQDAVLQAFGQMGFRFTKADNERGRIYGVPQQLPFYQEIEFFPPQQYRGLNQVELSFVADHNEMDVVLEMDKRGGLFTEGSDSFRAAYHGDALIDHIRKNRLRDAARLRAPRHLGHNPAGGAMVVALLAMLAGITATGFMMTTDAFWGAQWVEDLHEGFVNATLLLIALHVAGVIFASLEHGENLVRAMFTGRKRAR